jgi:hypothetical protein
MDGVRFVPSCLGGASVPALPHPGTRRGVSYSGSAAKKTGIINHEPHEIHTKGPSALLGYILRCFPGGYTVVHGQADYFLSEH